MSNDLQGEADYKYKVVIIGAAGSGKTAIVDQLIEKKFSEKPKTTVGVDYRPYRIKIEPFLVQLELWDTAGQENYKSIAKTYFRNSVGCVLVFDVTNQQSFDDLSFWLQTYRELGDPHSEIILVGNKTDLEEQRVISADAAEGFAKENELHYYETSAVSGKNIPEVFDRLAHQIFDLVKMEKLVIDKSGRAASTKQDQKTENLALTGEVDKLSNGCAC